MFIQPHAAEPKVRFGILSTANVTKNIIPAVAASAHATISAVASRTVESAQVFATKNNIPKFYGTYDELLADPDIDVVYVPLPNKMHREWVVKCLEAKKHVLCEKPLALTLDDVDVIVNASKLHQRIVAEAVMSLHLKQSLVVQSLLAEKKIGDIQVLRGSFQSVRVRDSYRNDVIANGGGSLWDVGCYFMYLARYILQEEPCEVFGRRVMSEDGTHDESFFATVMFRQGKTVLQFNSSFRAPPKMSLEILGSCGCITLANPFKATVKDTITLSLLSNDGVTQIVSEIDSKDNSPHVYSAEVDDMCLAVRGATQPKVGSEFSYGNVRAILALHESARTGLPIKL